MTAAPSTSLLPSLAVGLLGWLVLAGVASFALDLSQPGIRGLHLGPLGVGLMLGGMACLGVAWRGVVRAGAPAWAQLALIAPGLLVPLAVVPQALQLWS